jgi:hypothetical protein
MTAPSDVNVTSSGATTIHTLPVVGQATMAVSLPVVVSSDQSPIPVAPQTLTWTQSSVTLAAATSASLIASNASRKALRWMVSGVNPMTAAPGAGAVTVGVGFSYNGASATGFQGGSDDFTGEISAQQFSAISTLGTTVILWEGA